ncbi:MAG: DUF1501 domain-containing protein [Thermoanaerobaculia bacterium]
MSVTTSILSRRQFLSRGVCSALGAAAVTSTLGDLLRVAAAAPVTGDYKALVCVFLSGGNDASNVIVPRSGSDYAAYAAARGSVALPQASLLPITPITEDGRSWGLHPSLSQLQGLFAQKKLALLANVGPLCYPITRDQLLNETVPAPPQLFSHEDQAIHWQTSLPDREPHSGWGGRAADLVRSLNTNASISMSLSIAGANTFGTGNTLAPYQVSDQGTIGIDGYDAAGGDPVSLAFKKILGLDRGNVLENAYRETLKRAIDNDQVMSAALGAAPPLQTVFPDTALGRQLMMIARIVGIRNALGFRRQIFFCAADGYDTHGDQLPAHAELLGDLSQSLKAFYDATVELGVADSVTSYTASDFGRTYLGNGGGTDHGWGSHQVILGGAVKGGELYGRMPVLTVEGPDDSGEGRWIPTTSVDEYSAPLARWFGIAASDLPLVLPNLGRFARPDLGFMA